MKKIVCLVLVLVICFLAMTNSFASTVEDGGINSEELVVRE